MFHVPNHSAVAVFANMRFIYSTISTFYSGMVESLFGYNENYFMLDFFLSFFFYFEFFASFDCSRSKKWINSYSETAGVRKCLVDWFVFLFNSLSNEICFYKKWKEVTGVEWVKWFQFIAVIENEWTSCNLWTGCKEIIEMKHSIW